MILSGDTMEGLVEPAQRVWNTWGMHLLVLLSFALQVTLLVMAEVRQRKKSWVVRAIVWSAYMLADTVAVYTLGHFFLTGRSAEHEVMALWAPLLLVHLGGQDNITAYAVEDNKLWLRHLQNLGVQVAAAAYVLYQSSIFSRPFWLRAATILMFVVGVLKYGERVWVLKHASTLSSCLKLDIDVPWEKVDSVYHVTQREISRLYSLYYGKFAVTHSPCGRIIRSISLLATIAAFLLFHFHVLSTQDGLNSVDVTATYILLVGALVLEMTSVLRLVCSESTTRFLRRPVWRGTWGEFVCSRLDYARELILSSMQRAGINTLYWSGSMGQLDLLDLCSRTRESRRSKIVRWMARRGCSWIRLDFSSSIPVPAQEIIQVLTGTLTEPTDLESDLTPGGMGFKQEICTLIEELKLLESDRQGNNEFVKKQKMEELMVAVKRQVNESLFHFLGIRRMGFEEEIKSLLRVQILEESILVWHIATHGYLIKLYKKKLAEEIHGLAKAIEALSKYAVFLLAAHPLPPAEDICSLNNVVSQAKHIPTDDGGVFISPCSLPVVERTHDTGVKLGEKLKSKGMSPHTLLAIAHVWVHILYSLQGKLGEDFHVRQLSNGGEFLTFLTILVRKRPRG